MSCETHVLCEVALSLPLSLTVVLAGMGLIVNAVDPITTATVASRLVVFVWCFMILLLLTMYTGNAAAILTARRWSSSIQCEQRGLFIDFHARTALYRQRLKVL